jgi:putative RecB family exonuclease
MTALPVVAAPIRPTPGTSARQPLPTSRNYLSYSAVKTYQQCPRRYYFRYVAELQPDFIPGSLVFGAAVHAAIELHYRRLFEGLRSPTLDELVAAYDASIQAGAAAPLRLGKSETLDSLRSLAARMLKTFQEHPSAVPRGQLLAVEEELRYPLLQGCPPILGRIDLITVAPFTIELVDFKTARSGWGLFSMFEAAPQLMLYAKLAKPIFDHFPNHHVSLRCTVLTKTQRPRVETHSVGLDERGVRQVLRTVREVWTAIQAGLFYPTPSAMQCANCQYARSCVDSEAG